MTNRSTSLLVLLVAGMLLAAALWLSTVPGGTAAPQVTTDAPEPARASARASAPTTREAGAAVAPGSQPQARPSGRAAVATTVVGRVLDATSQAPVPDARVQAQAHTQVLGSARTGADGRFELRSSDAPSQVTVRATGLVPARMGVPAPDAQARVDLGDLRLARGCRVVARVRQAADGRPLAGAPLWHLTRDEDAMALGHTGADGTLALDLALPPTALPDDPLLVALTPQGLGQTPLVVPTATDAMTVEVLVRPGGALAVTVVDETGARLEPVELALEAEALPWSTLRLPPELRALLQARTDAQGSARLERLPLVAAGAVTVAGSTGWALWARGPGLRPAVVRDLALLDGGTTPVLVRMVRAQVITLTVHVHDPQGRPVPRVAVRTPVGGEALDALRFRFAELPVMDDGTVRVVASAPEFTDQVRRIPIPAGARQHDVELTLEPVQRVSGQVVDPGGAPVPGQPLQFLIEGGPRGWISARSDAQGAFRFAVGAQEDWRLAVRPRTDGNPWLLCAPVTGRGGRSDIVLTLTPRPPGGATLSVTITTGGAPVALVPRQIACTPEAATDQDGGRTIQAQPGQITVTGLEPGAWRLRFQLDGDAVFERGVAIAAGQTQVQVALDVGALGSIAGEVRFPGVPPEALPALVTIAVDPTCGRQTGDGRFPVRAPVGRAVVRPQRGTTFRLEQVPADQPLVLELLPTQGSPWHARTTVTVPAGGMASALLVATPGGYVRLRSDRPLPAGLVHFEPTQAEGFRPQAPLANQLELPLDALVPFPAGEHRGVIAVRSGIGARSTLLWSTPIAFLVRAGATTEATCAGPGGR